MQPSIASQLIGNWDSADLFWRRLKENVSIKEDKVGKLNSSSTPRKYSYVKCFTINTAIKLTIKANLILENFYLQLVLNTDY